MMGFNDWDDDAPVPCTPERDLPEPLGENDLDVLDELLRENGDCDEAAEFADHVKAIMAAYDKLYYGI